MAKKHIAVCVPSLGTVSIPWAAAFSDLIFPLNYGVYKVFMVGKTVAEARNECVQTALDAQAHNPQNVITHLFWIDDDVIVQSGALIQLLQRRKPIVSGVYFTKCNPGEPLIFNKFLDGAAPFVPGEFREVWGHGMGLTLVELEVYRKMQSATELGVDRYGIPAWYRAFDATQVKEGKTAFGTEDFYFLDAAHKMGISTFIDQSQEAFGWHFDTNSRQGFPPKQWDEWRSTRQLTWDTPEGSVVWKNLHC